MFPWERERDGDGDKGNWRCDVNVSMRTAFYEAHESTALNREDRQPAATTGALRRDGEMERPMMEFSAIENRTATTATLSRSIVAISNAQHPT